MKGPILVSAGVIRRDDGRVLVAQRMPSDRVAPGEWEFPGGKVEAGEHPRASLVREIKEELGLVIEVGELVGVYSHIYEHSNTHVVLAVYWARPAEAEREPAAGRGPALMLDGVAAAEWIRPHDLVKDDLGLDDGVNRVVMAADRPIVADVMGERQKSLCS